MDGQRRTADLVVAVSSRTARAGFSWNAEELLYELACRRWTMYVFGDRIEPTALAAVNRVGEWADVLVLRGHDRAAAYRTLVRSQDDPLTVSWVVWHYVSGAVLTIRAVLDLSSDVVAEKPYPIPDECRVLELARRPMTIRLGGSSVRRPGCPR